MLRLRSDRIKWFIVICRPILTRLGFMLSGLGFLLSGLGRCAGGTGLEVCVVRERWLNVSVSGLPYSHKKSRVIGPARSFSNGLEVCLGMLAAMLSAAIYPLC